MYIIMSLILAILTFALGLFLVTDESALSDSRGVFTISYVGRKGGGGGGGDLSAIHYATPLHGHVASGSLAE